MKKVKKITALQKRVAEKYSKVLEALETKDLIGRRKYNKMKSLSTELKTLSRKSKSIDDRMRKLAFENKDIRQILIREKFVVQNQLRASQRLKYELELEARASRGFIKVGDKTINLDFEPLTDEQKQVLNRLERSLEEYTTGDMNITKFYNEYDFDIINETTLRLFAEGEGLI